MYKNINKGKFLPTEFNLHTDCHSFWKYKP